MMGSVDEAIQNTFCQDRVREEGIPVPGHAVGCYHQGATATPLIDELVDILSLLEGKLLHSEVVHDKQIRLEVSAQTVLPGVIGVASTEVRQESGCLYIQHFVAHAARLMPQGLDDMTFTHTHRTDKESPFLAPDELTGGQISDLLCWHLGIEGKIEAFKSLYLIKVGFGHPSRQALVGSSLEFILLKDPPISPDSQNLSVPPPPVVGHPAAL